MRCVSCGTGSSVLWLPPLCSACCLELHESQFASQSVLRTPSDQQILVHSLFQYRGLVKSWMRLVKVHGDWKTLELILYLWLSHPLTQSYFAWADEIISAPSSLWARLRGRFDIAGSFASLAAQYFKKKQLFSTGFLFWGVRKQSRKRRGVTSRIRYSFEELSIRPSSHDGSRLLLIDDIVTTGFTMAALAQRFTDRHIRVLTFADAGIVFRGAETIGERRFRKTNPDDASVL